MCSLFSSVSSTGWMVTQLTWQIWMAATAKYSFRIKKILLVNTIFPVSVFIVPYCGHYLETLFKYNIMFFIYYITVISHKDVKNTDVLLRFSV